MLLPSLTEYFPAGKETGRLTCLTKKLGTKEAEMKILGCDLHVKLQSIAMVDTETGELTEKTLSHKGNEI
jgi:hypothetical protein